MDIKFPLDRYVELAGRHVGPERYRRSIALIRASGVQYEFRTTVIRDWHTPTIMQSITREIPDAPHYAIQNFRSEKTLDPDFVGGSFTRDQMHTLAAAAEHYVRRCEVRM